MSEQVFIVLGLMPKNNGERTVGGQIQRIFQVKDGLAVLGRVDFTLSDSPALL